MWWTIAKIVAIKIPLLVFRAGVWSVATSLATLEGLTVLGMAVRILF